MKFKVHKNDLLAATAVVGVVTPSPITSSDSMEGVAYLFNVKDDTCEVYSTDVQRVARASFKVSDVEKEDGEGSFTFPAALAASLQHAGDILSFEVVAKAEGHTVSHSSDHGSAETSTIDPRMVSTRDKDYAAATDVQEFPTAILVEALSGSRPYLAKYTGEVSTWNTAQMFDKNVKDFAKGDGFLQTSDGTRSFYFKTDIFKGKHMALFSEHLPSIISFLGKCGKTVKLRIGKGYSFLEDETGAFLGWTHLAEVFPKFTYYHRKYDQYVLMVDRAALLGCLNLVRPYLGKSTKMRVTFDLDKSTLVFHAAASSSKGTSHLPVELTHHNTDVGEGGGHVGGFAANVHFEHFMKLVDSMRSHQVELRVYLVTKDGRETALFRTIDEYLLDDAGKVEADSTKDGVHKCVLTRYMPSYL